MEYSLLAAREATARLGHDDACAHYLRALDISPNAARPTPGNASRCCSSWPRRTSGPGGPTWPRSGSGGRRHQPGRRGRGDAGAGGAGHPVARVPVGRAERRAARPAPRRVAAAGGADGPLALRSRVLAALARACATVATRCPDAETIRDRARAVRAGRRRGRRQRRWPRRSSPCTTRCGCPGTRSGAAAGHRRDARRRDASGDDDLVAEAHLLRAAALIELGDPAGRDELLTYITLAGGLGHARGRWGALTRRATFAQLAGRAEEAARLGEQALELGLAIGEPDAVGCFCTSRGRWSPSACASRPPSMDIARPAVADVPDLRGLATRRPRRRRRQRPRRSATSACSTSPSGPAWKASPSRPSSSRSPAPTPNGAGPTSGCLPHAGTHVIVGGCASYHAAVDHHLGALAASLGDTAAAEAHFRAALAMHERLGAAGWARLSEQALAGLRPRRRARRRTSSGWSNGVRLLCFDGKQVQLPDSKGLGDLAALIGARGATSTSSPWSGTHLARTGADPVLDDRRRRRSRPGSAGLDADIDEAEARRARRTEPRSCAPNATR